MLSYILKSGCYLALIEKRHTKIFYELLEKNKMNYKGVLHFVEKMNDEKAVEDLILKFMNMLVEGTGFIWGIWENKKIIGAVVGRDINSEFSNAEIAYFIDCDYQGKGIIRESCSVLLSYLFEEYMVERVVIKCDENNQRSQNIAKKFGFIKEGIERHSFIADGKFKNMIIWGMLKEEYEKIK